MTAKVIGHSAT